MVAKSRDGRAELSQRQYRCPINSTQDGVCGCVQFWELTPKGDDPSPDIAESKPDETGLRSPSPTPPGPPREICFFWYHGNCRRGGQCKLAHKSHITWPMSAPPGYMHYEPCKLVLCPLRQDLVDLEKERKSSPEVGAQVGEASVSLFSQAIPVQVTSGGEDRVDVGSHIGTQQADMTEQAPTSLIDPSSRALNGSYSDPSDSDSVCPDEEVVAREIAQPKHSNAGRLNANIIASPSSTADGMDYFDISDFAHLPLSSDTDESPLLSLSHAGTLRKRKQQPSPNGVYNDNKRSKPEPAPGSIGSPLVLDRVSNSDTKLSSGLEYPAAPNTSSAPHAPHFLPPNSAPVTTEDMSSQSGNMALNLNVSIPTEPRALRGGKLICYYWYHKGECTPNGKHRKCTYAHTMNLPYLQVHMPSKTRQHNPDCRLPLCPHLARDGNHARGDRTREVADRRIKEEPFSSPHCGRKPIKNEPFSAPFRAPLLPKRELFSSPRRDEPPPTAAYSSSPRDSILQGRHAANGQLIGKNKTYKNLPKLTGANRQRFKAQKQSIEKWQAENNVKTPQQEREEKGQLKRVQREVKRQKRLGRMRAERVQPLLKYEDELPTMPCSRGKAGMAQRLASELYETSKVSRGRMESFDPVAKLNKQSFHPITGFRDHTAVRDTREEMEDIQYPAKNAPGILEPSRDSQKPSFRGPLMAVSGLRDAVVEPKVKVAVEQDVAAQQASTESVASQLPTMGERLPWDTDEIRAMFGM
jgi:hypothetical protein